MKFHVTSNIYLLFSAGIKAKLGGGVNAGEGRDHVTYNFVNPIILVSGYDKNITDVLYQVVNYIEDFEFESLGEFHHHMGGLLGMYIGVLKVIFIFFIYNLNFIFKSKNVLE